MKFNILFSSAAAAALFAVPAWAADLHLSVGPGSAVRIPVAGKSRPQLDAEVAAAARQVCAEVIAYDSGCLPEVLGSARLQLDALGASGALAGEAPRPAQHLAKLDPEPSQPEPRLCVGGAETVSCLSDAIRAARSKAADLNVALALDR
jgi:hypothetical protein